MKISIAGSQKSKQWKTIDADWEWLLKRLAAPKRTGETYAEYRRMSKDEQSVRKDVGGFVGGELKANGRRTPDNVKNRWFVTARKRS